MSRVPRVYAPSARETGQTLALDPEEGRHLATVLRAKPGDEVRVFDGRGGEWRASVTEVRRPDQVRVVLAEPVPGGPDASFPVTLYYAGIRPERLDWAVQKATEIGVDRIVVLPTLRAERSRAPGEQRLKRWARVALEAAKQSGRRRLPEVGLETWPPPSPPAGSAAWVLDPEARTPVSRALQDPAPETLRILVGPEGGLAPDEVRELLDLGWAAVRMGPRVLRAETAGLVALTLALHRWGDLGSGAG